MHRSNKIHMCYGIIEFQMKRLVKSFKLLPENYTIIISTWHQKNNFTENVQLEGTDTVESDFKAKDYTYVIGDHNKQTLASEAESEAAAMLLKKDSNTKVTIHFDTTSRSNIDGEWPSIILQFSNNVNIEYRLQPIFFAYEDRSQITKFFCETFERLAAAVSIREDVTIQPATLWEKIYALMLLPIN